MLHIIEGGDKQEDNGNYSNEEKGNHRDDNGRGANLGPSASGDHISAVRALEVGQRVLSKGGL